MSNYQVGDKFVIEIEEICGCEERNALAEPHTLYRAKGFNTLAFDKNGLDKLERLDGDYINENFGELQNEAYEAGRKAGQEETLKWSGQNEDDRYKQGFNDAVELIKKLTYVKETAGKKFDLPSILAEIGKE